MINGASPYSKECELLSAFGNKWSATRPPKDRKYGNTNTVKEGIATVEAAVEAAIDDKQEIKNQKVNFFEIEAFSDPRILDSDSKIELYRIDSIKPTDSGNTLTNVDYEQVGGGGGIYLKIII